MADTFYTLDAPAEGLYKEKMSKFISFAVPVTSATEAKEVVAKYQKEYFDARHVCWAYMIGTARNEFLSNDNGEPSGTAGKPILGQINSFNLTNIVIIVVRYFGGIKLGTSGLIVAYREAAREAINAGNIIECHEMASISFTFPYLSMNDVMRVVKDPQIKISDQVFDNACQMTVTTRLDNREALTNRLLDIDGVTLNE
ncbi:MAG: YigZ family protein [Muribaculaceae bacterium]|nr:YigZ family protein [Muribaculaceae bacterium]MBR3831880.1 YigZ family protein [Muribaculaceae bacterium]